MYKNTKSYVVWNMLKKGKYVSREELMKLGYKGIDYFACDLSNFELAYNCELGYIREEGKAGRAKILYIYLKKYKLTFKEVVSDINDSHPKLAKLIIWIYKILHPEYKKYYK